MAIADRDSALAALGLQDGAHSDEIERAYEELRAVWEPQLEKGNQHIAARAEQELARIAQARALLLDDGMPAPTSRLHPAVLGLFMIVAFGLGFVGMQAIRRSRAPAPAIVRAPQNDLPAERVRLSPPDVSVSSANANPSLLSTREQQVVDAAVQDFERGIDALDARDSMIALNEKAIPAATKALGSDNENVRMNAAMVINSIALGPDDSPNDKKEVARLRPFFKSSKTLEALAKLADDPNSETRLNVAYGLGNLRDPAALEALSSMARDEDDEIRAGVAYGLGRINDPMAVATLIKLLNDSELSVRMSAAESLRPYDTPEAKSALSERLPQETDPEIIARIKSVLQGEKSPEEEP